MKDNQYSRTADMVASSRAWHRLVSDNLVFDDPFAIHLTSPMRRFILTKPLLRRMLSLIAGDLTKYMGEALARSRYAEDLLNSSLQEGVSQFVSVGAGFDSFSVRRTDLLKQLSVYELDHPSTQRVKRDRLASLGVILPEALEFVPVDFEKEGLKDVLYKTSYKEDQLSFFAWLGVVGYLTEDAVYGTIASIAEISCPGSHLVLDFPNRTEYEQVATNPTFKKFKRAVERKGEAGQSSFEPDEFISKVSNLGFEVVECLSPDEKDKRYFSGRTDELMGFPFINYVHFRRGK